MNKMANGMKKKKIDVWLISTDNDGEWWSEY